MNVKSIHWARSRCSMLVLAVLAVIALFTSPAVWADDEENASDANDTSPAYVRMTTSKGEVYLELNREKAPITVVNFLRYVEDEFYDGTIFHRVIANFLIQGGGFTEELRQKPTRAPIRNEWQNNLKNERGTIAMARTPDPDSATAQFFINVRNNPNLDQPISGGAGYAVFGKVVHGMDVVDAIREVETTPRGQHANLPVTPVIIEKVRVISKEDVERAKRRDKPDAEAPDAENGEDAEASQSR
jgi:peptidyl-prolyl cis-trans isomerase A (cyclophilin A)